LQKFYYIEIKREMEFQDIRLIKGYHAHVYFDEATVDEQKGGKLAKVSPPKTSVAVPRSIKENSLNNKKPRHTNRGKSGESIVDGR
jgi:hypothetical protein